MKRSIASGVCLQNSASCTYGAWFYFLLRLYSSNCSYIDDPGTSLRLAWSSYFYRVGLYLILMLFANISVTIMVSSVSTSRQPLVSRRKYFHISFSYWEIVPNSGESISFKSAPRLGWVKSLMQNPKIPWTGVVASARFAFLQLMLT